MMPYLKHGLRGEKNLIQWIMLYWPGLLGLLAGDSLACWPGLVACRRAVLGLQQAWVKGGTGHYLWLLGLTTTQLLAGAEFLGLIL